MAQGIISMGAIAMVLAPLLGAVGIRCFRDRLSGNQAGWLSVVSMGLSAVLSVILAVNWNGQVGLITGFEWATLFNMPVGLGLQVDGLSLLMSLMITTIATLIAVYSIGYMAHDDHAPSFFAWVSFFVFWMLVLVMSDSVLGLFFGWEGVGLCSFLLIGFWNGVAANQRAAIQAFVVNRLGDLGIWVILLLPLMAFQPLGWMVLSGQVAAMSPLVQALLGMGVLLAVCGKSAQGPLYVWLPNAMAGPTPVSALIHAATMVTAGVYLLSRAHFLVGPAVQPWVMGVGLITSLLGAILALGQSDIKRVLAFSTMSQLGLMVMACGIGAYHAALFHMVTHAGFKALLFLGAGSVIHGLHGEQNITKMGGLRNHMPITFWTMSIAVLAIMGVPPLSGFFSKDAIIVAAMGHSNWLLGATLLVSLLTSVYMIRLWWLVFIAPATPGIHPHESPRIMTIPLLLLGVVSVVAGGLNLPIGHSLGLMSAWLQPVVPWLETPHTSWITMIALSLGIAGLGGSIGWALATRFPLVCRQWFEAQFGIPLLLNAITAQLTVVVGWALNTVGDRVLIQGGMRTTSWALNHVSKRILMTQTGRLGTYLLALLVLVLGILGSVLLP